MIWYEQYGCDDMPSKIQLQWYNCNDITTTVMMQIQMIQVQWYIQWYHAMMTWLYNEMTLRWNDSAMKQLFNEIFMMRQLHNETTLWWDNSNETTLWWDNSTLRQV